MDRNGEEVGAPGEDALAIGRARLRQHQSGHDDDLGHSDGGDEHDEPRAAEEATEDAALDDRAQRTG